MKASELQLANETDPVTNVIDPGRTSIAIDTTGGCDAPSTCLRAGATRKNLRLQYLRGIAALAVLLFHCADYLNQVRSDPSFLGIFSPYIGMYGVAIFFVLSGYLMSRLSWQTDPCRFLVDRIIRIYPMMFIVVAVAALGYLLSGYTRRPDPIALTLFPAGPRSYFLGIEWTLIVEVTFYLMITAAMLTGRRRYLEGFFLAWLVVLAILPFTGLAPPPSLTPTMTEFLGQSANSAFMLGFLLPRITATNLLPRPTGLLLMAAVVASLAVFLPENGDCWVAGISSMMVVAAALKAEPAVGNGLLSRIGLRLGDASYALYLCHVPVIVISGNLLPESVTGGILWLGWATSAIVIALAFGSLDIRMNQCLKVWANGLSHKSLSVMAASFIAAFVGIATFSEIDARADAKVKADAWRALQTTPPHHWPDALTAIDSSAVLKGGRVVIRGYAIDLAQPDGDTHVAILQNGHIIGFDRMTRMRPKIAEASSRPDITSIRFGFGVVTSGPLTCSAGPISAKIVLSSGKVASIESPVLDALCSGL